MSTAPRYQCAWEVTSTRNPFFEELCMMPQTSWFARSRDTHSCDAPQVLTQISRRGLLA